jgi:acetyl-CoA carboxylase carboxyltransferase component
MADTEGNAINWLRKAFSYLPSAPGGEPPHVPCGTGEDVKDLELRHLVPANPAQAYDVRTVVGRVVDPGTLLELSPEFGTNLVTGLARLDGNSIAIMANQPQAKAGSLDISAMAKANRLLRLVGVCGLPLVSFVDTPGVLTTKDQEHNGLVRRIYSMSTERLRPNVPKISIILRKGVGFALFMMGAGDPEGLTFTWPEARISFTGPEPAAKVLNYRELAESPDPARRLRELADRMRPGTNPWRAAELGYSDGVIDPADTRSILIHSLRALRPRFTYG